MPARLNCGSRVIYCKFIIIFAPRQCKKTHCIRQVSANIFKYPYDSTMCNIKVKQVANHDL